MAAGKIIFAALLLFILIYSKLPLTQGAIISPSVLKGGLVYSEESSLGPVYLNRDHINFVRTIDTSALTQSAQAIRDFTTLYHTFCQKVGKHITPFDVKLSNKQDEDEDPEKTHEIVFSPVKYLVKEGQQVCKNMGARLPEIRDRDSYNTIRFAAIAKGVIKIRAGVYFDEKSTTFRYYSDDRPANYKIGKSPFEFMSYGGEWRGGLYMAAWEEDSTLTAYNMAPKHFVIYSMPQSHFTIRLSDLNEQYHHEYIMCERPIDRTVHTLTKENNLLLQLAHHACKRDEKSLISSTQYILSEIEAITNLNITIRDYHPKMSDYFPTIEDFDEEEEEEENQKNPRKKRETKKKTKEEVDKDIQNLNKSFKTLIKLLSTPKFTTTTPAPVKSEVDMKTLPTPPPITSTLPLYLIELYHLWNIQKIARVHAYPFDMWLYMKTTSRNLARNLPNRFRRKIQRPILPEEKAPEKYISSILHKSADAQAETTYRAEILAADRMYKQVINKRIDDALDEYLDNMQLEEKEYKNDTLVHIYTKVQESINKMTSTTPHHLLRTRRTPQPDLGLTAMGSTNVANSMITGEAPLSWMGEALGYLLGFPTKNSKEFKQISKNARAVEALSINQQALTQTVNLLSKRLTSFGTYILQSFKAAATVTMEQDLKIIIRHMQVIQQLTLTKYANVLMAAQLGKTSPYAISQKELVFYSKQLQIEKGISIVTRVEDTKSTVALIDNQIQILIQTPIIDDQKLFNFYHIKPLPIFIENKTFYPELDAEYIAMSRSGSRYAEISTTEFTRCVIKPDLCTVSNPTFPVNEYSLCVVRTYQSQKLMCPLQQVNKNPKPHIFISGNKAIFSTPEETHLYIKCSHHAESHTYTDETVTINGTGEVTFQPSCTITLPGGSTFDTPASIQEQEITGSGLFEILRRDPVSTGVIINRLPEDFPTIPPIILQEVEKYDNIWEQAVAPDELKPFFIRISAVLTGILFLTVFCYCCCPTQTKDCWKLICRVTRRNTLKRTRKSSFYDIEEARQNDILLHKLARQMDELSHKTASLEPKKWTSAGQLFTSFGKTGKSQNTYKHNDDIDVLDHSLLRTVNSPNVSFRFKDQQPPLGSTILTPKKVQFGQEESNL